MSEDVSYLVEDEDDGSDGSSSAGRLVVPLGAARSTGIVPLAFTMAEDLQPITVDGVAVSWTKKAMSAFCRIRDEANVQDPFFERNLPYGSLRTLLEVTLHKVSRIERGMGLDNYGLNSIYRKELEPFVYLDSSSADEVHRALQPVLHDWIVNFLVPLYAEPGRVPKRVQDQLLELAEISGLLSVEDVHARLLPWQQGPTGTAHPPDRRRGFQLLVDQAARLLSGNELFRGLGSVRRIVTSSPGAQSIAEMITDPIEIEERGAFSLVVTLEVVTFPSMNQPLITMDVKKRLWLRRLSDKTIDRSAIGGTVFSSLHPDRVLGFHLRRKKCEDGEWRWMPDNAYEALKRELFLPLGRMDGHAIGRGEASTATSRVLLIHRDSVSEGRHGIKRGVPEVDKLEAFASAASKLTAIGIVPFSGYTRLRPRHGKAHEAFSRMINAPTVLGALLELLETGSADDLTPAYLKTLDEPAIDELLRRQLRVGIAKIGKRIIQYQTPRGREEKDQSIDLETLIAANRAAVGRLYPNERPLLVIFHEDRADSELRILRSLVRLLWGEALEIITNHLPTNSHGPRTGLPGKELKDAARSGLRVEVWRSLAQQIEKMGRRTFCLVMAREWYSDPNAPNLRLKDDRVNKAATRQALSAIGSSCVQFLLPPKSSFDTGTIDLADFLLRAQAAMKDLISAHSGRIEGVRDAVVSCLGDTDGGLTSVPREIIGITVVRKNSGRSRGGIGTTFLPIAVRIDVDTGRCEMCCAYEGRSGLIVTRWERFSDALATVSRISPVRLAREPEIVRTRFMTFVEQIISGSVDDGARPVVIIDSSNCVRLWNWLTDQRLDASKIEIGQKQWMQDSWKGARIVRVRQELAPGIIEGKEQYFALSSLDDRRPKDDLIADMKIEAPSSPFGLFRLDSVQGKSGCVSYLSVGRKTLQMNKRGASCYRKTEAVIPLNTTDRGLAGVERVYDQAGLPMSTTIQRKPWIGQWPTPNPLEIVVTLRQAGDDPDRLAELIEHLRYGFGHYAEWTTLPAPLFFERVVRDYISGFSIEDATSDEAEDDGVSPD